MFMSDSTGVNPLRRQDWIHELWVGRVRASFSIQTTSHRSNGVVMTPSMFHWLMWDPADPGEEMYSKMYV